MATPSTPEPTRLVLAGMAGDSYGTDDDRAPLVLLHGLTFSRRTWRPVLDELLRVDPDRRVLVLDLPGPTPPDMCSLPFSRIRRPMFPLDRDLTEPAIALATSIRAGGAL